MLLQFLNTAPVVTPVIHMNASLVTQTASKNYPRAQVNSLILRLPKAAQLKIT